MIKYISIFIFLIISCDDSVDLSQYEDRIKGDWKLVSVTGDGISNDNNEDFDIILEDNGNYTRIEGNLTFTGRWFLRSSTILSINWIDGGTSNFTIDKLTDTELVYTSNPDSGTGLSQLSITYSFIKE